MSNQEVLPGHADNAGGGEHIVCEVEGDIGQVTCQRTRSSEAARVALTEGIRVCVLVEECTELDVWAGENTGTPIKRCCRG